MSTSIHNNCVQINTHRQSLVTSHPLLVNAKKLMINQKSRLMSKIEVCKEPRRKKWVLLQSQCCEAGPHIILLGLRNDIYSHEMPEYEFMLSSLDCLIFQWGNCMHFPLTPFRCENPSSLSTYMAKEVSRDIDETLIFPRQSAHHTNLCIPTICQTTIENLNEVSDHLNVLCKTKDPISKKLAALNDRLDDLLLELGDLETNMPDEDDLKKLGNPNASVNLPKLREFKKNHESDSEE